MIRRGKRLLAYRTDFSFVDKEAFTEEKERQRQNKTWEIEDTGYMYNSTSDCGLKTH